jgi:hypothetical protein
MLLNIIKRHDRNKVFYKDNREGYQKAAQEKKEKNE